MLMDSWADGDLPAQCDVFVETGDRRYRSSFKVAYIKVRQGVIDKAMHGARLAVHVLIDQSGDKIWCEGDDKGLKKRQNIDLYI